MDHVIGHVRAAVRNRSDEQLADALRGLPPDERTSLLRQARLNALAQLRGGDDDRPPGARAAIAQEVERLDQLIGDDQELSSDLADIDSASAA
jgi:hypothetical protein